MTDKSENESLTIKRRDTIYEDILGKMIEETEKSIKESYHKYAVVKFDPDNISFKIRNKIPYQLFKKYLIKRINDVYYTNGIDDLLKEVGFSKIVANQKIQVPCIGVDKNNLGSSDCVLIDIDSESTKLPFFCKLLIIKQGKVLERSSPILMRDVCLQIGQTYIISSNNNKLNESITTTTTPRSTRTRTSSWSLMEEYYSIPYYYYKGKDKQLFNKSINTYISMGYNNDDNTNLFTNDSNSNFNTFIIKNNNNSNEDNDLLKVSDSLKLVQSNPIPLKKSIATITSTSNINNMLQFNEQQQQHNNKLLLLCIEDNNNANKTRDSCTDTNDLNIRNDKCTSSFIIDNDDLNDDNVFKSSSRITVTDDFNNANNTNNSIIEKLKLNIINNNNDNIK